MKKILFIPQRGIGDLIHALPLMHSIKQGFEDSELIIPIVDKRQEEDSYSFGDLFQGIVNFSYKEIKDSFEEKRISFYRIKDFPDKYKIEEKERNEFEKEIYEHYLKGEEYDLTIVLRKFNLENIQCQKQFNLNSFEKKEKEHVVERNLRFTDVLKISKKYCFELNSNEKDSDLNENHIFFVLSSGRPNKKWHIKGYKEVADFCLSKDYTPILIGSKKEYQMSKEIEKEGIINLVSEDGFLLGLDDFYKISKNTKAVIGPDTGLIHLADASGAKVIGLYGPTRPYRFAPYNNKELVISTNNTTKSMKDIKSKEVISKLEEILK